MPEQNNLPVDRTLDGIKADIDRQMFPSPEMAKKTGVERKPRGGMIALSLNQVEALITMAEANK